MIGIFGLWIINIIPPTGSGNLNMEELQISFVMSKEQILLD